MCTLWYLSAKTVNFYGLGQSRGNVAVSAEASHAEKNYKFGGLAGALGWYIGDLSEFWAYRYRGI